MCFLNVTFGQALSGEYYERQDRITFIGDSVKFNIQTDGGVTFGQLAEGTFEVLGDFLFIEAKEYKGARSSISTRPKKGEFPQVFVTKPNGKPVEGATVFLLDSLGKTSWDWDNQIRTNEEGLAKITDDKQAKKLQVDHYSDRPLIIDYNPEFDYVVSLVTGEVLENRTIVFQIHSVDSNSITLSWFTQNLGDKLNTDRNLKKFARLAKKSHRRKWSSPRLRVFKKITTTNNRN